MSLQDTLTLWQRPVAVPAAFVTDELLRMTNSKYYTVLLFVLRENITDPAQIATRLRMSKELAEDALQWMAQCGLKAVGKPEVLPQPAPDVTVSPVPPVAVAASPEAEKPVPLRPLTAPPKTLTAEEMKKHCADPMIYTMLHTAEAMLGKTFTSSDTATLLWLVDWAGVPPAVLITVISYCVEIGKPTMRKIQSTAVEWLDKGIETAEQAERHMKELKEFRGYTGMVRRVFGIHDRALSAGENNLISGWQRDGFDEKMLTIAYEKTVSNTGSFSIRYLNTILANWKKEGIRTPEEVAASDQRHQNGQTPEKTYNTADLEKLFNNWG